jgi:ribosome-associated protein
MSDSKDLEKIVFEALDNNKAIEITKIDVSKMTSVIDTMFICSATSSRHAKTLADKVIQAAKTAGFKPLSVQGEELGEWVLVDLLDIVVHIMLAEAREFYSLEKLWNTALTNREQSTAH